MWNYIRNKSLLAKTKYYYLRGFRKIPGLKVLDIGLANQSISDSMLFFADPHYYGIDIERTFTKHDEGMLCKFYEIDLEKKSLAFLDSDFDIIIISHVIEHIDNGIDVIDQVAKKIKKGGAIYIEYPNVKSIVGVNGWRYHFHDDHTHKKIYSLGDIVNILLKNGFKINSCGKVNTFYKTLFFIPRFVVSVIKKSEMGSLFPHYEGKISHIFAIKD